MDMAPIIMTARMGAADQAWANALRARHFPPERNFLDAHITLFHHLPSSALDEIRELLRSELRQPSPRALLGDVFSLGRGVAYRVESPDLLALRMRIADAMHGLLTPQDQHKPRLHITVQNKVEPAEARALLAELSADFEPRPLKIYGIALDYYRGGPWEAIGCWPFRG